MQTSEWDDDSADLDALEEDTESWTRIKPRPRDLPRRTASEVTEAAAGEEPDFKTTYQPSRHEAGWLLSSLGAFYEQNLITDVLYLVKGGKEANVYCCAAHPSTGEELLAAKVYRPRQFRNLRNDRLYREGRPILTGEGRPVKDSDGRMMRALGKKTDFGVQVQHTSWLMYEYTTLERLYTAGASVPRPFAAGENAVLMSYFGDRKAAAPTLSEVRLDKSEAHPLFVQVKRTVEAMLALGIIHGDLSAYNILYWEEQAAVIDFPQVVNLEANPHAADILLRDLTRVCEYFSRLGVPCDPAEWEGELRRQFGLS